MSSNIFLKNNLQNSNTSTFLQNINNKHNNVRSTKINNNQILSATSTNFNDSIAYSPTSTLRESHNNLNISNTSSFMNGGNSNDYSPTSSFNGGGNDYSPTSSFNGGGNDYSPTSTFRQMPNNNFSSTSNIQLTGGNGKTTEVGNNINYNDINNLINMLTTESEMNTQLGGNIDSDIMNTEVIENKLYNILNNNHRSNNNYRSNNNHHSNNKYQSGGVVTSAIAGAVAGGIAGGIASKYITETILKDSDIVSEINLYKILTKNNSSKDNNNVNNIENTTTDVNTDGDDERINKIRQMQGGKRELPPGLKVFAKICKYVSEKLSIPNGPKVKKIAGKLQRDIKEKNPNIDLNDLFETSKKHFNNNISTYKKLL